MSKLKKTLEIYVSKIRIKSDTDGVIKPSIRFVESRIQQIPLTEKGEFGILLRESLAAISRSVDEVDGVKEDIGHR